jgi:sugar transferase EpsL
MNEDAGSQGATRRRRTGQRGKRVLDLVLCGAATVVLSPVMLAVAVAIRVAMGPPVLFHQVRPGLDGRPFRMVKFRTMTTARAPDGAQLPDELRVTRLGRILRRLSLDELPELWNVLRGDMSLVGPRPLLMAYLARYTPEQARRHEVRPGITGWAQVHGRRNILMSERFQLDVWYIDHWSLLLDLRILFLTALKVVRAQGVEPEAIELDPFQAQREVRQPPLGGR